ncbi:MAG: NAD(P)-dependent oxidoreductase [Polyangiaceae bacterium]
MSRIFLAASFPEPAKTELEAGLAHHTVLRAAHPIASNLAVGEVDPAMLEAEVIFGQPPVAGLLQAHALRWVHLNSAGYTRYGAPAVARALAERGVRLTTSSQVYAEPCANHAVALLLALSRELPGAAAEQHGAHGWPAGPLRARARVVRGLRIVVLGYGAIGRRIVALLAPFQAQVSVVRATPRGDEPVPTFAANDAARALAGADAVVSALPESDTTGRFLDAERLAVLAPGAVVINVGRGTTLDQNALLERLRSGALGGAALDVTDPEPLPPEHPLWREPNCLITPHVAGGRKEEMVELVRHFLENLRRFETGEPLSDRVI